MNSDSTFSLSIAITNSTGMPKELFVIKKDDRGLEYDTYLRVCSLSDIKKIKVDRTSPDLEYRSSSMTYVTDNIVDLEESGPYIIALLTSLVEFYNTKTAELIDTEEIIILS
jgi:hypothetical protein